MKNGQSLVALLVFIVIAITITSSAVSILVANSLSVQKFQQGIIVLNLADSGAENSLLRLLRDPNYAGETFDPATIGGDSLIVTVTGGSTKTIESTARSFDITRKVQVVVDYINNELVIQSWKEVF